MQERYEAIYWAGQHWPSSMLNLNDPTDPEQAAIFEWLQSVLWIVEIPFVSRPEGYNSQRINNLTDENIPHSERVAMVKSLADASDLVWQGIIARNSDKVGLGLSQTMSAWSRMLPFTVDPYLDESGNEGIDGVSNSQRLRDFWQRYDLPHSKGCLFSGAGGGFLFVIGESPVEGGSKIQINHSHFCKPFLSDSLRSEPHSVPFS